MTRVTMLRLKLRPAAECQHTGCGWARNAGTGETSAHLRSHARWHVQRTGHIVNVVIRDITEYAPDDEDGAS